MATVTKKYQIEQALSNDDTLILHPETDADITKYDNTESKLKATDVKGALDEIVENFGSFVVGAVTGVKGDAETVFRKGNVNLTPENIGAERKGAADTHNKDANSHSDIRSDVAEALKKAEDAFKIAEGKNRGTSFDTYAEMTARLKAATNKDYQIGDNLYIKELGVPDYWVCNVLPTNEGIYGYYEISIIESDKVDLSEYQKKIDSGLATASKTVVGGINEVKTTADNALGKATLNAEEIEKIEKGPTKVFGAKMATKLETARAINLSGEVTGGASFDGSAGINISAALTNTGITAGTYSVVTVDAKGRARAGGQIVEVGAAGQTAPSASLAVGGLFFKEIET